LSEVVDPCASHWVKLILTLGVLFCAANSQAADDLPTGVCTGQFCGPGQGALWSRLENGRGLDRQSIPRIYAGICFVNGRMFYPDRKHHVGLLLDDSSGDATLGLRLSFYAATQPYAELDLRGCARALVAASPPGRVVACLCGEPARPRRPPRLPAIGRVPLERLACPGARGSSRPPRGFRCGR